MNRLLRKHRKKLSLTIGWRPFYDILLSMHFKRLISSKISWFDILLCCDRSKLLLEIVKSQVKHWKSYKKYMLNSINKPSFKFYADSLIREYLIIGLNNNHFLYNFHIWSEIQVQKDGDWKIIILDQSEILFRIVGGSSLLVLLMKFGRNSGSFQSVYRCFIWLVMIVQISCIVLVM